jgi:hypothetical protein
VEIKGILKENSILNNNLNEKIIENKLITKENLDLKKELLSFEKKMFQVQEDKSKLELRLNDEIAKNDFN